MSVSQTAARLPLAGAGPTGSVEVVTTSVAQDPAERTGWFTSSAAGRGMTVYVGDAAAWGSGRAGIAEQFDRATATSLEKGRGPREIACHLDVEANRIDGAFATLMGCDVDFASRTATVLQVGHPPLLALSRTGPGRFLDGGRYPPLGVGDQTIREPVTWILPADVTLLLFSFGLVERRAVPLDVGLHRLRAVAGEMRHLPLADLVDGVVNGMGAGSEGDFLLVGLRPTGSDERDDLSAPGSPARPVPSASRSHRRSVRP